jgi:hypothetical protein
VLQYPTWELRAHSGCSRKILSRRREGETERKVSLM